MPAPSTITARSCLLTSLPILRTVATRPTLDLFGHSKAFLNTASTKPGNHAPVKSRVPPRSWDSHMHVVEPQYPLVANAAYKPMPHTIRDAIAFESSLGIENVVLVQPSIYGSDNSCLLDALRRIGPSRGRGIVVIDPANTEPATLRVWHTLGVRGVRMNFKSSGEEEPTREELRRTLFEQAELIRPLGWMIQVHTAMSMIPLLEEIIPQLGVKVCIDHFGGPDLPQVDWDKGESFDPYCLPGFQSLIALLKAGRTYVKISAPYRLSKDEGFRDLEIIIREFLREAPNQILYATDWPHTRFSSINVEPFTEQCLRICGSQSSAERVFRLNAEELMDSSLAV